MRQVGKIRDLLVVTSEDINTTQWRGVLEKEGWHVYFAESEDEAFDCLRAGLPSACVLDVPASAAIELIRLIQKGNFPVTVLATDHDLLNYLPNRETLIQKPLSPSSLLEILKKQSPQW